MTRPSRGPRRIAAPAALLLCAAALTLSSCARRRPVTVPASPPPALPPSAAAPGLTETGLASWYGGHDGFNGKPTSSGEIFDDARLTAAHRTLPLGTWADVTNLDNGKTVRVRINDRGPFVKGRILDLSRAAAAAIDAIGPGVVPIRLTVVREGPAVAPVSPTGAWSVQIGSFASAWRAETFAGKARAAGHRVFTEAYDGLTRVKVGPFASRGAARRELSRLESEGFEGIVVPQP